MAGDNEGVGVVAQAMSDEAAKWSTLSGDMAKVHKDMDGLGLMVSAFFANVPATASAAKRVYDSYLTQMTSLANQAKEEFTQIHDMLLQARDDYEETDGRAADVLDLTKLFGRDPHN